MLTPIAKEYTGAKHVHNKCIVFTCIDPPICLPTLETVLVLVYFKSPLFKCIV